MVSISIWCVLMGMDSSLFVCLVVVGGINLGSLVCGSMVVGEFNVVMVGNYFDLSMIVMLCLLILVWLVMICVVCWVSLLGLGCGLVILGEFN